MADMPRHIYAATYPTGYDGRNGVGRLPPGDPVHVAALFLNSLLWTYVPSNWPHLGHNLFVFHDSGRLARLRGIGKRAVEEQLRQLQAARLATAGEYEGKKGFYLHVPPRPAADALALLAEASPTEKDQAENETPNVNGDRSIDRRSPIDRSAISSARAGIADRSIGRSPIDRSGDRRSIDRGSKEELGGELGIERGEELGAAASSSFQLALAKIILDEAIPPSPDARVLSRSSEAPRRLAQLLAGGEHPDEVRAVLALAPAIVEAKLESADWYGPEMFTGGAWVRWTRAATRVRAQQRLAQSAVQQKPTEEQIALAQAEIERARVELEAAAPQRAQQAQVLLSAEFLQAEEKDNAMLGQGRGGQSIADARVTNESVEKRQAMNRQMLDLRTRLGRDLTDREANEVRARYGQPICKLGAT